MSLNSTIGHQWPTPQINAKSVKENNSLYRDLKKDPVGLMAQIVRQQRSIYTKEITHWKAARSAAENTITPRRGMLLDLYEDICLDGFLIGITEKRVLKVSNKSFGLFDTSTEELNVEATKLIQKQWLIDLIKHAMQSKYYGHSLIYFNEFDRYTGQFTNVELVPRHHVRPETDEWLIHEHDLKGFNYRQPKFANYMFGVGGKTNLGLYNPAAPLYILKKHSWSSWDEFEEIFGVPIRTAKVASTDSVVRAEVQRWLEQMGSASWGMFPEGTELDIKESKQTDAFKVFNEKRKAANEELEVMILGVKNASQDKGTYGQQVALQEEQDEVEVDDKTWIKNLINKEVLPRLRKHGYPIPETLEFRWDETKALEPKEQVKIFKDLHDMGYKLDTKQVSNTLNVTIEDQEPTKAKEPKESKEPKVAKESKQPNGKTSLEIIADLKDKYFD